VAIKVLPELVAHEAAGRWHRRTARNGVESGRSSSRDVRSGRCRYERVGGLHATH
jgi:hypothetical protein